MKFDFHISSTNLLTQKQQAELASLVTLCRQHDHTDLSYPMEDDLTHFLAYLPNGMLVSCLTLLPYEDDLAECCAFTHPDFRNQGVFSRLLEEGLAHIPDSDLLFAVSGTCADTLKTLEALGAEKDSEELVMECDLADSNGPADFNYISTSSQENLEIFSLHQSSDTEFSLYQGDTLLGTAFAEPVSENTVCLHHVEILSEYRHKGFGTVFFTLLLPALARHGFQRALLQVAGDNTPAISLYKKTGFSITKTLSYYFY